MGQDTEGAVVEVIQIDQLPAAYDVTDAAIAELRQKYEGMTANDSKEYKAVTKAIGEVRTLRVSVEKKRKDLKAGALEYGRAVDAEARRIREQLEDIEDPLKATKQEVDDEKARAKAEKEEAERARVQGLHEKVQAIKACWFGASDRSSLEVLGLIADLEKREITEEEFAEFADDAKAAKAEAVERLQAARKYAQEREDSAAAMARMAEEQKALQAELEEQQAELEAEQAKVEEERQAIEQEKLKAQIEAEAKERFEKALKKEEEQKAAEEAAAKAEAERLEAMKPDVEKLISYSENVIGTAIGALPEVEDGTLKDLVVGVRQMLEEVQVYINAELIVDGEARSNG
jgi:hypothetical protein